MQVLPAPQNATCVKHSSLPGKDTVILSHPARNLHSSHMKLVIVSGTHRVCSHLELCFQCCSLCLGYSPQYQLESYS